MTECEPPLSHGNRISNPFFRSRMSRVHFRDLVCLESLGPIPLFLDPHSLQGVYSGYSDLFGYASYHTQVIQTYFAKPMA